MTGKHRRQIAALNQVRLLLEQPPVLHRMKGGGPAACAVAHTMTDLAAQLHVIARELTGSASVFANPSQAGRRQYLDAATAATYAEDLTKRIRDGLR